MPQKTGIFESEKKVVKTGSRAKLWLLGGASVIGGIFSGKAAAQSPEQQADSIFFNKDSVKTEIPQSIKSEKILPSEIPFNSIDSVSTHSNDIAKKWFKSVDYLMPVDEFIKQISSLSPNTEVQTVYVESLEELKSVPRQAQFDIRSHKITLFKFEIPRGAFGGLDPIDISYLRNNIEKLNAGLPLSWWHEIEHEWVNDSIPLLGYNLSQITAHCFQDEARSLLSEFINLRALFLTTGNVKQTFSIREYRTYLYWLKKKQSQALKGLLPEEADLILKLVGQLLNKSFSDPSILCANIKHKSIAVNGKYNYYFSLDRDGKDEDSELFAYRSFDANQARMMKFDDIDIWASASDQALAAYNKNITKLANILNKTKPMKKIRQDFSALDAFAEKFNMVNGAQSIAKIPFYLQQRVDQIQER